MGGGKGGGKPPPQLHSHHRTCSASRCRSVAEAADSTSTREASSSARVRWPSASRCEQVRASWSCSVSLWAGERGSGGAAQSPWGQESEGQGGLLSLPGGRRARARGAAQFPWGQESEGRGCCSVSLPVAPLTPKWPLQPNTVCSLARTLCPSPHPPWALALPSIPHLACVVSSSISRWLVASACRDASSLASRACPSCALSSSACCRAACAGTEPCSCSRCCSTAAARRDTSPRAPSRSRERRCACLRQQGGHQRGKVVLDPRGGGEGSRGPRRRAMHHVASHTD